jgi:recombinational DNA repair ATPase RecF
MSDQPQDLSGASKRGEQTPGALSQQPQGWMEFRDSQELPEAREGWFTEHPTTGKPVHVVPKEDYDFLFEKAKSALAAEREIKEKAIEAWGNRNLKLASQLATEREKVEGLVDALEKIADDTNCTPIIGTKSDKEIAADALAKTKL